MSLICGVLQRGEPARSAGDLAEELKAMLAVSPHQERDGLRSFVDPVAGVALAYCHTATFGQRADQPGWPEDDAAVAGVDGEVFDAASHLPGQKARFGSARAGAVVGCYSADAEAFPAALDGVFSLFVWDRRLQTLQLSSDRMGHKLVYYYEDVARRLLVFSTELKAVLAHPAVPRQLDERVLPLYLQLGFVPGPLPLAKGVRKLRPAECLSFAAAETGSKRFWRPELETGSGDFDYWVERTREQIVGAVGRSIGGAEKVGVGLSGGIDSSVILAAAKQGGFVDIQTFTLAYKGQEANENEAWAGRVAEICGVPHQTVTIDAETEVTPGLMSSLLGQSDEPFISAGRSVSQYFLGRAQRAAGIDSTLNGTFTSPLFNLRRVRKLAEAGQSLDGALQAGLERSSYFHGNRLNHALIARVGEGAMLRELIREASLVNRG